MKLRSSLLVALSVLSPVLSSPQVILHPAPSTNSKNIPSLSPIETNAIVAHHLGLAGVFDWLIEEVKESWHYLFDAAYVHPLAGKDASVSSGDVSSLFLIVKSDHPEDFVPSNLSPSFSISSAPSPSSFTSLLEAYVSVAYSTFTSVVTSSSTTPPPKSLLDIFDMLPSSTAVSSFFNDLTSLVDFVESEGEDRFGAFEINGLGEIAKEHGRKSEVYQLSAEALKGVLSTNSRKYKLALITLPSTAAQTSSKRSSRLTPPTSGETCYASEESCQTITSNCTGHGKCVQSLRAGQECFVCKCGVTKEGGKSTQWAGETCLRKDVSAPFTLLLGSTVFLILILVGSVALLYSVGAGELPSTLTGAVHAPKHAT